MKDMANKLPNHLHGIINIVGVNQNVFNPKAPNFMLGVNAGPTGPTGRNGQNKISIFHTLQLWIQQIYPPLILADLSAYGRDRV
jgi:hypothetical protein